MHEAWSLAQAAMHGVGNDPTYNAKPAWLSMAHQQLDQAVAAAYGWLDYTPDMPDDEILKRLLALNLARSAIISVNNGAQTP